MSVLLHEREEDVWLVEGLHPMEPLWTLEIRDDEYGGFMDTMDIVLHVERQELHQSSSVCIKVLKCVPPSCVLHCAL